MDAVVFEIVEHQGTRLKVVLAKELGELLAELPDISRVLGCVNH
jgi:hypothetical protein